MSDTFDVVMAAYQSAGAAERDFDALVGLVKDRAVRSEGMILVQRDAIWTTRSSSTSGATTARPWRAPSPARSTR